MKIVIISDTHGNVKNFKKVITWLNKENIKMILHCGDIGSPEDLKESLDDFDGEFLGVMGNMDREYKNEIEEYQISPKVKVFKFSGEAKIDGDNYLKEKRIAFTHYPDKAREFAESGKYDIVFYGHTHKPWEEKVMINPELIRENKNTCRLVNPGEVAGQLYKPSFAVYDTEKDLLELKILERL